MSKILAVLLMFGVLSGCAWMCANGPQVTTTLSATVDSLKAIVGQLEPMAQYDAEINLAYVAAKASLVGAQALLAQSCPDPTAVAAVVEATDKVVVPSATMSFNKAKKLKLVK
jgi:hypothetical protein